MSGKFIKNCITILTFLLFLQFLNSCSDQQEPQPGSAPSSRSKFNLGLIPEQDLFTQKERYAPLARYISEKAGVDVQIIILSRYGNIVNNFLSTQLDGAFFGSFTGALAIRKLGVEPLARPVWFNDKSTYYGLVFVRKDSSIKDAASMKGKRFAFVDKATTAGYLLPLAYFKENAVDDYQAFLKESYFAGTHEDVIYDVLNKKADIGAAKNTVFFRLSDTNDRIKEELVILRRSPDVPENGLGVRKGLDDSIKNKLKQSLY